MCGAESVYCFFPLEMGNGKQESARPYLDVRVVSWLTGIGREGRRQGGREMEGEGVCVWWIVFLEMASKRVPAHTLMYCPRSRPIRDSTTGLAWDSVASAGHGGWDDGAM